MKANTAKPKSMPPKELILERLSYDPDTGIFRRKMKNNRNQIIGEQAGSLSSEGYLIIQIDKVRYYAHRLAYFLITGKQPMSVDHVNGIRTDNRAENLRSASRCENVYNTKKNIRNRSGHKNIHWNNRSNKWDVHMNANRKSHWGGCYSSLEEAVKACKALRLKLHGEFANHGESE
ncbi:HNH endonuclease [Salmonella enterica]|uniref:Endonuclease n=5 Tax=Salmonella enterica TaxID=28901 RepID=A0A702NS91_SALMU|nr:HNH endonuclease [Salmonella enterica]EAW1329173.1 endonuclease [Salmonella enterica subsp. enterica]EBO3180099.1 endonuclease [Salmonella enterica subsp. enterica serovar Rubislaw]EBV0535786.1 endonuclease [Salmonella enterica subsp. enterica serovar Glostrup]EBV8124373.1 endonuclease [Salmonella enterica subsp. enterica serovar Bareilly]EBZ2892690.1 endonuclease [Salmonella enterica subsp. enterica serovar Braenderup]EBZ5946873.1 endonuclease [Salmonella enterica subsp. enterica serovar 